MADNTITPLQLTINPLEQSKPAATVANDTSQTQSSSFWSGDAPSFKDILDTINPLQHIPGISTLYQALTGDTQSTGSSIAGGLLFGGPVGLVASIFDAAVQQQTGTGVAGNLIAAIEGKPIPALQKSQTQLADNAMPDHLGANQRANYNAYVTRAC